MEAVHAADYEALTVASRGRRITCGGCGTQPDAGESGWNSAPWGGDRHRNRAPSWETVRHWIAGGALETGPDRPAVTELELVPAHHIATFREKLPLRVMAHFADGSERDVSGEAVFHANDAGLADVDERAGVATIGTTPGVAAVLARAQGRAVFQAVVHARKIPTFPRSQLPC
ncbi:MAG: hypothetical protein R3F31_10325 [Verrucomicrobiales bacterium]